MQDYQSISTSSTREAREKHGKKNWMFLGIFFILAIIGLGLGYHFLTNTSNNDLSFSNLKRFSSLGRTEENYNKIQKEVTKLSSKINREDMLTGKISISSDVTWVYGDTNVLTLTAGKYIILRTIYNSILCTDSAGAVVTRANYYIGNNCLWLIAASTSNSGYYSLQNVGNSYYLDTFYGYATTYAGVDQYTSFSTSGGFSATNTDDNALYRLVYTSLTSVNGLCFEFVYTTNVLATAANCNVWGSGARYEVVN